MRFRITSVVVILALAIAGMASAQSTSELTGRIIYDDDPLPGVTVTLTSPALQGQKLTVSNGQGDYIFKGLPAGDYHVRFDLESFASLEYDVRISTSQPRNLDAVMYPEAVQDEIVVTSQYETVSTGSQGSETMEQSMIEKLPILRTLQSAVLLSAGTQDTGPNAAITISGAQSYESLYTMNGVVLNENLRGQPFDLYIEDAILETTTITSSASAEYGRFAGGVVNMVTKSGGNEFSGSFRVNMTNESWNGETPLTTSQEDKNNYTYEATFGGYILRDALWFFAAGRDQDVTASGQLFDPVVAGEQFPTSNAETRLEGKLTGSIGPNHRLTFGYIDSDFKSTNYVFPSLPSADFASVDPERTTPNTGWNLSYTGVITDNFFVEGLYSQREFLFEGSGGDDTSIAGGTVVIDYLNYVLFNAPIFCGVCPPEERSNKNFWGKASWFVSGAGTHDLVFGFDTFSDIRKADNWQSASGYLLGTWTDQDYSTPGSPLLVMDPDSYIIWGAVPETSQGNSFKTNSLYVNDTWRISDKLTVNLGLRYDQNDGTDQGGAKTVDDWRISPRLSASYDVKGDGTIIVSGGLSRYVGALSNSIGDAGSAAGNPVYNIYLYDGPSIRAGTPEYPTNGDAIDAVFDHFFNVYGGVSNTDLLVYAYVPGLTPKVGAGLKSPYGDEATVGGSFRLGNRGVIRADYVYRNYGDFYAGTIVPNRTVSDPSVGITLDEEIYVNNDSILTRKYNAVMTRFDYRIGSNWNIGANYTWSETKGNHDGETGGGGPAANRILEYQEYKEVSWNLPSGLLLTDQTHKFGAWVQWDAIATTHNNLNISLLQSFVSGTPYDAFGSVNTVPYVGDPASLGYAGNPPPQNYYFSGRGAFRMDNITRTDIAINYSFFINLLGGQLEAFVQPEVINIFNEQGAVNVNTTTLTSRNSDDLVPFNPFTETPVQGVNWDYGPSFGEPQQAADYQQPRTFRVSFGLRF
jgi:outer membrane receptor protein involved in Fe transport